MQTNPTCEYHNVEVSIVTLPPGRMPHVETDEERAYFSKPRRKYECPVPGCTWVNEGGGPPPA